MLSGNSDELNDICPVDREEQLEEVLNEGIQDYEDQLKSAAHVHATNCNKTVSQIKGTKFFEKFEQNTEVQKDLLELFLIWANSRGIRNVGEFSDATEHVVNRFPDLINEDVSFEKYMGKFADSTDQRDVKHALVTITMKNGNSFDS